MNDKIISLAKKLKALSDRGEGGEKENARHQLEKLMGKHGLSFDSLNDDAVHSVVFDVAVKFRQLFVQIVVSVCNNNGENIFGHKASKVKMIVDCTNVQAVEIEAKFEFYQKEYSRQLEENNRIFYKAFVHKNNIFSNAPSDEKELSERELADLAKVADMMRNVERAQFHHQLGQ